MKADRMPYAAAPLLAIWLAGCAAPPPAPPPAVATPPPMYFYPERKQTEATQERDRYECYRWAVRESGFDPGMTPVTLPPPPARDGAEVAAGAAAGAVIGAAASAPRHAASGAVLGAIFGAALGAIAQESRAQTMTRSEEAARAAALARLDGFRRAMRACMEARGYRVG